MKTYRIDSSDGLKQFWNGQFYRCDGHLRAGGNLKADLHLYVGGNLDAGGQLRAGGYLKACGDLIAGGDVRAGGYLKACGHLIAGGDVRAGGYLKACGHLIADGDLTAGGDLRAGEDLKAGGDVRAGVDVIACGDLTAGGTIDVQSIFCGTFNVKAKKIITHKLPFWRHYYADMKPLRKWRDEILNLDNCWDDFRQMVTKEEAEEICAWDGWHWLIRIQLEMFFGLRKEYVMEAENEW
jgi:hypothetical protein